MINIFCDDRQFSCSLTDQDERGFTIIDWLLDIIRHYASGGSVDLICNSHTRQVIIDAYVDWLDVKYEGYIIINGQVVTFQVNEGEDSIRLVPREAREDENLLYTMLGVSR